MRNNAYLLVRPLHGSDRQGLPVNIWKSRLGRVAYVGSPTPNNVTTHNIRLAP